MPQKPRKSIFTNKTIILIKIASACLLFFCCCFFFFQNKKMFWEDLKSWFFFFPILYFAGIILVCVYISILVGKFESKEHFMADRYDLAYRIVFTITLLLLVFRIFFADSMLYMHIIPEVSITIIVLAVISGIVTWITPKIKDNDNTDF